MSDYHVLEQSLDRKTITIVLHYPVPVAAKNVVNKNYRDIIPYMESNGPVGMTLVNPETDVLESVIPWIADTGFNPDGATEPAKIAAGEVIEVTRTHRFSSLNLTNPQKQAEIEALWGDVEQEVSDELDVGIQYYGYSNDV